MAKPTYYPDWAMQDTTLPATGKANKVRPKETIRNIGWDKGQIPTAEEVNWLFNNWGLWIHYFADEFIPTIPNTYLPKNGTSISFSGDLSGTISWSGNNQGTGNIQVADNSHLHLGDNISDATNLPTAGKIVKRDANGAADFRRDVTILTDGSNADLWFRRSNDNNNAVGLNYAQGADLFQIYYVGNNGTDIKATFQMLPGVIQMTNPRSLTGQEGQPNSLVRYDHFSQNVNSLAGSINNVNGDLQNYKNAAASTFIQGIRQSSEIQIDSAGYIPYSNGRRAVVPGGAYLTSLADYTTGRPWIEDVDGVWYKYLQYSINGNWYNIGSL